MTIPAHITAAIRSGKFTYCGEAQLSNFGETARKGRYVEFLLDDGPDGSARHPFLGLQCGREKGQRFGLIAVPLGDDDAVAAPEGRTEPKERKPATTRAEKARRMCGIVEFQNWIRTKSSGGWDTSMPVASKYERTSARVKSLCSVKSKSEFDTDANAAAAWDALEARFIEDTRLPERH